MACIGQPLEYNTACTTCIRGIKRKIESKFESTLRATLYAAWRNARKEERKIGCKRESRNN